MDPDRAERERRRSRQDRGESRGSGGDERNALRGSRARARDRGSKAGSPETGCERAMFSMKLEVFGPLVYIMESLILAQNERWRRVLSMQVVRQGGATRPRAADW